MNSSDNYSSCQMNLIEYAQFGSQRLAFFIIHTVERLCYSIRTRKNLHGGFLFLTPLFFMHATYGIQLSYSLKLNVAGVCVAVVNDVADS